MRDLRQSIPWKSAGGSSAFRREKKGKSNAPTPALFVFSMNDAQCSSSISQSHRDSPHDVVTLQQFLHRANHCTLDGDIA